MTESARLNKMMAALQAQLQTMNSAQVGPARNVFRNAVRETGGYGVQQVKAASATDALTEAIQRQKVTFGQHRRGAETRNALLREQYQLQKMMAMNWTKDGFGRVSADVIIPRDVPERLTSVSKGIAEARAGTLKWSDLIKENRMRMGLWSKSMQSAGQNMVNWGKNAQWSGRQMQMGFTMPFILLAAGTATLAYQVDKEMTKILKVYDYAAGSMAAQQTRIREDSMKTARTMARTFGQAATDTLGITAALAAQGRTGSNLQQATATISQGMFLGDLNQEDALKTATSLLTVFRREGENASEGNKRLADSFAYLNALENATTLSMKDMTVAIPRLSGVVRLLGGDVQDIGTLMAATSAAGIDPGMGANALKSVLFRGVAATNDSKAGEDFFEATGKQIEDIVNATNAEAIPTLQQIGLAYKNSGLEAQEQLRIVRDLFGIWRGSAAELVIQQLLTIQDATSNVGRAHLEAEKGVKHFYEVQRRERAAMQASPSGRFKIGLESVKIELAELGKPFLEAATVVLGAVAKIIQGFNGLSDGAKSFLITGALFVALVGPVLMLLGLFTQLIGNMVRLGAGLGSLLSGFKLLNTQQRVAAVVAGTNTAQFMAEANAANTLAAAIANANKSVAALAMTPPSVLFAGNNGANVIKPREGQITPIMTRNNNGQFQRATRTDLLAAREADHAKALAMNSERTAAAQEKSSKSMQRFGGGASAGVGMMAMMLAGTNQWIMALGMVLMLWGSLGLAGKAAAAWQAILNAATIARNKYIIAQVGLQHKLTGAIAGSAAAARGFSVALITSMGPIGIIAVALAAAAGTLIIMNRRAKEFQENLDNIRGAAEGVAETMGLVYQTYDDPIDEDDSHLDEKVKIRKRLTKELGDGLKIVQAMNKEGQIDTVKRFGMDLYMKTGDSEAATKAMEVYRDLLGGSEKDFDIKINFKYNVEDELLKDFESQLGDITELKERGGAATVHMVHGVKIDSPELTENAEKTGKAAGELLGQAMNDAMEKGDVEGAIALAKKADTAIRTKIGNAAQGIVEPADREKFKTVFGFYPEDVESLGRTLLSNVGRKRLVDFNGQFGTNAEVNSYIAGFANVREGLNKTQGRAEGFSNTLNSLHGVLRRGANLNDASAAASGRNADGIEAVDLAAEGAAASLEDMGESQKALNDMRRDAMRNATDSVLGEIEEEVDARHEAAIENMEASSEKRLNKIEAEEKQREAEFEAQGKALDKQHKADDKGFESRWKIRTKSLEDSYDSRIKSIEAVAEAEKKADEQRKKMYEDEKSRIQRLSELYNMNTDLDVSLNSGNMDEAAKIANNIRSTQEQWGIDDAIDSEEEASKKRDEIRAGNIERLRTEKEARMDLLREEQDAAKEALALRQEAEKEALSQEKDRYAEGVEARKEAEQLKTEAVVKAAEKEHKIRKKYLEMDLLALRSMTPRNAKEMNDYLSLVQTAYGNHGIKLDLHSKKWSGYVATAMKTAAAKAHTEMADNNNWARTGRSIGEDLAMNILGMSMDDFMKWVTDDIVPDSMRGGNASTYKSTGAPANSTTGTPYSPRAADRMQNADRNFRHSGGPIGSSQGSRAGRPMSAGLYSDEVPIIAQKGEFMIRKQAVDKIGLDNLSRLNSGNLGPDKTGRMHQGGMVGGVGGAIAGMMKQVFSVAIKKGAEMKSQQLMAAGRPDLIPPKLMSTMAGAPNGTYAVEPGKYGGSVFDAEQMANARAIINTGKAMGATQRDLLIGLMTAMQESSLRNVNHGDLAGPDSRGLFQQRDSWGPSSTRMNPSGASRLFFEKLLALPDRNSMSMTQAAQRVQRSAHPNAYAKWEDEARAIMNGGKTMVGDMPVDDKLLPGSYSSTRPYSYKGGRVVGDLEGLNRSFLQRLALWSASVGKPYTVNSGYRSIAEQTRLYNRWKARVPGQAPAAPPGRSNHNFGLASDGPRWGAYNPERFGLRYPMSYEPWHVEPNNARSMRPDYKPGIPGLKVGGTIKYDNTIANLHKNEKVLTAPLSAQLERGIGNLDGGGVNEYNITMDFRGALIRDNVDIEGAVERALNKKESRIGRKRVVK